MSTDDEMTDGIPGDAMPMYVTDVQMGLGTGPDASNDGMLTMVVALATVYVADRDGGDGPLSSGRVALILPAETALEMSANLARAAARIVPGLVQVVRYHQDGTECEHGE